MVKMGFMWHITVQPCQGLTRPSLALQKQVLIKNTLGGMKEHIIWGSHEGKPGCTFGISQVRHHLRFRGELVHSSLHREVDISPTAKYSKMGHRRHLIVQELIRRMPIQTSQRCPVVHMSSVFNREFPPRLRETGLEPHRFSLIHERTNNSFSSSILLVDVWNTLKDLNAFIF